MKKILVTGAAGFIGSAICKALAAEFDVTGIHFKKKDSNIPITWKCADVTNSHSIREICSSTTADVVIHCAGIAHQKTGAVDRATYFKVNRTATAELARSAAAVNPDVVFIFLSTVSVYGESGLSTPVQESNPCRPSSDYAESKRDAEKDLQEMVREGSLHRLMILRLAPVYDRSWHLNLDRRVMLPGKFGYVRVGNGEQKMSALARPNLIDYLRFFLKGQMPSTFSEILNTCDESAYSFRSIIRQFKRAGILKYRPLIVIPQKLIYIATRIAGKLRPSLKAWLYAGYDKLTADLVYDTTKMKSTGFRPCHSIQSVFCPRHERE